MFQSSVELTDLLRRVHSGDRNALDDVIPLVYAELKKIAASHLRREPAKELQTTALVHEAFVKLIGFKHPDYENRIHFFAIASNLMRQVLVDRARTRLAQKRSGLEVDLTGLRALGVPPRGDLLLDLDNALRRLAVDYPRKVALIEMRYFGGMTAEESAAALGITPHVARNELRVAHAWLHRELAGHTVVI